MSDVEHIDWSEELGRCTPSKPCETMAAALRNGTVLRDYAGHPRLQDGAPVTFCYWCQSLLVFNAELLRGWDRTSEPQADGAA